MQCTYYTQYIDWVIYFNYCMIVHGYIHQYLTTLSKVIYTSFICTWINAYIWHNSMQVTTSLPRWHQTRRPTCMQCQRCVLEHSPYEAGRGTQIQLQNDTISTNCTVTAWHIVILHAAYYRHYSYWQMSSYLGQLSTFLEWLLDCYGRFSWLHLAQPPKQG